MELHSLNFTKANELLFCQVYDYLWVKINKVCHLTTFVAYRPGFPDNKSAFSFQHGLNHRKPAVNLQMASMDTQCLWHVGKCTVLKCLPFQKKKKKIPKWKQINKTNTQTNIIAALLWFLRDLTNSIRQQFPWNHFTTLVYLNPSLRFGFYCTPTHIFFVQWFWGNACTGWKARVILISHHSYSSRNGSHDQRP